ncbi:MAG TPA: Rrf2 family transcriptional regulator [Kiritimatiellia bacterium]|nr:Rrf2 family transcriptional regulator [Kiritimatiellia bacterium]HRU70018.1 Rrf2 family transcriptional regulator [Kiritimatiellia bacterium]
MLGLLNISEAMSIALHTCASLAEQPDRLQSAREISERLGFSAHHFAKVVQQLVRAGILATERGPAGGARLARPPSEITLLEIYVAAGGSPNYKGCLLRHDICQGDGCALGKLMSKENERLTELLQNVTLESIVRSLKRNRIIKPAERTGRRT